MKNTLGIVPMIELDMNASEIEGISMASCDDVPCDCNCDCYDCVEYD